MSVLRLSTAVAWPASASACIPQRWLPANWPAAFCSAQNPKDLPLEEVAVEEMAISRSNAEQLGSAIPPEFSETCAPDIPMEIVTQQLGDAARSQGERTPRQLLDRAPAAATWRRSFGEARTAFRLNLSEISFLSSAGVGLLVKFHAS